MEPSPYRDGCAELSPVVRRAPRESLNGSETGRDAAALSGSLLELPGRDQLIADIPMDFPPRRDDRLRKVVDEAFDQAVEGERTEPLGQSRRPFHVDEQEHSRF